MKYLLIITIFLYSCTTQRKATNYFNNNPDVASEYCAEKYPVGTDTMVIVEHDTTLLKEYIKEIDSLEIHDTICLEYKERIKYIFKNNPPITKTITIEKENTAKIKSLQIKLEKAENKIEIQENKINELKRSGRIKFYIILFIILLCIAYIFGRIKNYIP
jgi:hypothetical protein